MRNLNKSRLFKNLSRCDISQIVKYTSWIMGSQLHSQQIMATEYLTARAAWQMKRRIL